MSAILSGIRPRFLLLVALLVGLLGLALWLLLPAGRDAAPAAAATAPSVRLPAVITVASAIGAGEILQPADLTQVEWAAGTAPANAILAGSPEAEALVGAVTRRPLAAGELLVPGAVIAPGDRGFLAAVVSPGNRAIAVSVDAATSAGGLIWPGDRVDVILTQEITEDGVPLGQRVLSETILADARVLSTDQTLSPATTGAAADAADKAEDVVAGPRRVPATVTIEVTPEEAERVTVAGTLGRLHLTLRAVALDPAADSYDGGWTTQDGASGTWAGAVSPGLQSVRVAPRASAGAAPAPAAAAAPKPTGVRVYRGSKGAEG